ncbi:hypothetical protein Hanom_Chr10g00887721 [Helianthus anomalus]
MWVSVLKKRDKFRIGMGSVQIEFRAETGFGTTQVLDRNGVGSGQVSSRHGFRIVTGFGLTRVSAQDEFRVGTSFVPFRPVPFRLTSGNDKQIHEPFSSGLEMIKVIPDELLELVMLQIYML